MCAIIHPVSDDKTQLEQAVDQALDAFVYAPIGLLFDGPALFPTLVEKGRNQVNVARMMGQMAVQMGQGEAEKRIGKAQSQVRESLAAMGLVPEGADGESTSSSTSTAATPAASSTSAAKKPARSKPAKKKPAAKKKPSPKKKPAPKKNSAAKKTSSGTAPASSSLGIPDYDSLSASQVVSRLRGLAPKQLDALKAYESATRARKTILNRITQLQKD